MNFYKRYLGDYMRDTAHLSLLEHGVYTVLLDIMYATGKPLPASLKELAVLSRARLKHERRALLRIANEFFPVNGDGFRHNKRADKEIAKGLELSEKQREHANKRWGKNPPAKAHADAMPRHMRRQSRGNAYQ